MFIDDNKFENFYTKIKNKYYTVNNKFINYFEKTFLINMVLNLANEIFKKKLYKLYKKLK